MNPVILVCCQLADLKVSNSKRSNRLGHIFSREFSKALSDNFLERAHVVIFLLGPSTRACIAIVTKCLTLSIFFFFIQAKIDAFFTFFS